MANGTHTALAHVMALSQIITTNALSPNSNQHADLLMQYIDSFFHEQILIAASTSFGKEETLAVYDDWRRRLLHRHFGLSTFFITQNGSKKGGIRYVNHKSMAT